MIQSSLIGESNPTLGFYTDFIGAEGGPVKGILAPGAPTWTQSFDDISRGVGAYTIDPGATVGAVDAGSIEIQYATYSANPNLCGICAVGIGTVDLSFQVTVTDAPVSVTPEPSFVWPLLAACGSVGLFRVRRRQGNPVPGASS